MIGFLLHGADHSFDQGDYIEAYNQYNRVLIFDMGNTQARDGSRAATIQIDIAQHMKLAMDYYDHGRYILSQREFNAVLQLDPDNETARRLLRGIDDRLRESGTQAEKDLRQDNEMWQVYLEGVEAYRAGEFKKAIELWNTVLKKYPKDKMTLENKRQAELRVKE
jgi:tetratricopeptide (TPR) repeat protein